MQTIWQLELTLLEQLQHVPLWIVQFFKGVTFLGEETFYLILMPVVYWCIDMSIGYRFTLVLLLSNWINSITKMFFHLPRPYWLSTKIKAYVSETSFGLPSGHSTNAAALWLFLASTYRRKKWLAGGFIGIMLLIMFSRLVLGVHFISDVLSGFLLGLLVLGLYFWAEKKYGERISRWSTSQKIGASFLSTFVFLLLGLLPIWLNRFTLPDQWIEFSRQATAGVLPDPFNPKSIITLAGVWLGMNLGYFSLKQSSHPMNTTGSLLQHFLRVVIGLSIALGLRVGLSMLFSFAHGTALLALDFLRYALLAYWIAFLAPMLFWRMQLYKKSV